MEMRFKIGDVVFIKTRTEICNIIDSNDCIGDCHFTKDMFNHCGSTLTIDQIDDIQGVYRMKEDPWHLYNDAMISHLYEEKDSPRFAVGDKVILDPWPCEVINVRYIKEKSRFLYTVKGIDFTKLVTADMLEIDASEYPKYNDGDVVGVYGYETDVKIYDVRKEGSTYAYKVYLADEETWIYEDDIAYEVDETPEKINISMTKQDGTTTMGGKKLEVTIGSLSYSDKVLINLEDGYEIKEEDGRVYAIKKKMEYPMSYEECCQVLGIKGETLLINTVDITDYERNLAYQMGRLHRLIICRDAYWHLYAKENNLGKSWKPDWSDNYQKKWYINFYQGEINFTTGTNVAFMLAFPTEEMRDKFYEAFKELIEQCLDF